MFFLSLSGVLQPFKMRFRSNFKYKKKSLSKTLPFLCNIGMGNVQGKEKKKLFADIFLSQFCEIQFEFYSYFQLIPNCIFQCNKRNGFGVRGRKSMLSQMILHISEAGVSG